MVWLILIPPLLAICLCIALLIPPVFNFFNSPAFPDYRWSQRITRELRDKGYSIRDTANVSRSENPHINIVALEVSSVVNGEQLKPYKLVKDVHSIIMSSFTETSPQPMPVDIIFVIVGTDSVSSYAVEVNFEDVKEFQAGKISEQEYFERWILHPDTLKIDHP